MGSTAADYDGNRRLDLFKANFSDNTSTLNHANAYGTFCDVNPPPPPSTSTSSIPK